VDHDRVYSHLDPVPAELRGLSVDHDRVYSHLDAAPAELRGRSADQDRADSHLGPAAAELRGQSADQDRVYSHVDPAPAELRGQSVDHDRVYSHLDPVPAELRGQSADQDRAYSHLDPAPAGLRGQSVDRDRAYSGLGPVPAELHGQSEDHVRLYSDLEPVPAELSGQSVDHDGVYTDLDPAPAEGPNCPGLGIDVAQLRLCFQLAGLDVPERVPGESCEVWRDRLLVVMEAAKGRLAQLDMAKGEGQDAREASPERGTFSSDDSDGSDVDWSGDDVDEYRDWLLQNLREGMPIHLDGLIQRPSLNGWAFFLGPFHADVGRWEVMTTAGRILVRPDNIYP